MISFKEFFSFKHNRFFWLNLIAMFIVVIAAAWGTLHWLDNYTRHGEAITVPNVKGLPLRQAENEINKQGLNAIAIDLNLTAERQNGVQRIFSFSIPTARARALLEEREARK